MTEPAKRPISRRVQAKMMRLINVPMRRVLALPVATPLGGRLMLAFLTGRQSGRQYRQPLSYVRDGTTLLTPGGGQWKLNLVEGRPVRIRLQGHDILARPELVGDLGEIEALLGTMVKANPRVASFIGIPRGPDGRFDHAALDNAVHHGFRIVRWHLDDRDDAPVDGRQNASSSNDRPA
jgi:hypothetical protein